MIDALRWGILGTGRIAKQFATGLRALPDAKLIAIGSRTQAHAEAFARQFDIPHRYGNYPALANDPEVDVVYIATPHSCHNENTLLCLAAGKPVLCEKPFMINSLQAAQAVHLAREKRIFLMEAMWTRFFPLMNLLRQMLSDGVIGDVRMLEADFGFRSEFREEERLFDPAYGGGSLLDVGVYPVALASMIYGPADKLTGFAHLGETGVDEQAGFVLGYGGGQMALLSSAIRTNSAQEAAIFGTCGSIKIHSPWWRPSSMTLSRVDQKDELIDVPYAGNGYHYEAAEVMKCLREGKQESALLPLEETLTIMRTLDSLRALWGLKYPME